jgi:ubiquitin-activating enzyme E1
LPSDQVTSSGQPFWSGPKKCPKPLDFDPNNDLHLDFVVAAANLRAAVFGLEGSRDRDLIRGVVAAVKVPPFSPRSNVRIAANEAEAEAQAQSANSDQDRLAELAEMLPGMALALPDSL